MPTITVDGPPIAELAKKRELVKGMTDVAAKVYGIPAQAMVVLIRENPAENVGVGGELIADRRKK
jgi:4-oxalocrotonate tautomerase